ncbi:hypothetical protein H7I94_32305, partial [Mycobacterium szulgai]|nr:hypothetical protein [Mycobacterium szulgai]
MAAKTRAKARLATDRTTDACLTTNATTQAHTRSTTNARLTTNRTTDASLTTNATTQAH